MGAVEARYWKPEGEALRCSLCPHRCLVRDGERGRCRVRENRGGRLFSLIYGHVVSANVDPLEKKPLYHFHPGKPVLSIGTNGCNFSCPFCQNYAIAQGWVDGAEWPPEEAVRLGGEGASIGIAYTYNEPFIWFEYVLDCARLAREAGLVNVLVTNGYVSPEPLEELLPYIDALNIDLKALDDGFYKRICGGRLAPVLETIKRAASVSHVEITNLLVTDENDSPEQVAALADWIASEVGRQTPLHLSRYFPAYKFKAPQTPLDRLLAAWEAARERLDFVYMGNVVTSVGADTVCPSCGAVVVERQGYYAKVIGLADGCCSSCGRTLPILV
ncbi:MAG TPA: AmmeMemoRadiSam system radical SAM enzyme [Alphaproteobacteria bacterium]|nr:AmmeMemoRadiSam system radical SAM enzyme [Alphaproteobacteria bacterium]